MAPDAQFIAIDTNPDFIRYLRQTIPDQRFAAVHGSAADVAQIVADHGFDAADYVLSGLPFSTLPPGVGPAIAKATFETLRPCGPFQIGRAHVCTPVTNAHLVCRLLLEKQHTIYKRNKKTQTKKCN